MSNRKTKKEKRSITYVPNVDEFTPFPRRQILSINIKTNLRGAEVPERESEQQQLCAMHPAVQRAAPCLNPAR